MRSIRRGFSLIEALVVLAIGGMALAIIFTIGVKAGDTGFSLGRRAMSAAEHDIAISDLRTTLRSFDLRPALTFDPGLDRPIRGEKTRLEGSVVMERATQCAPLGWAGRLVLSIEPSASGATLYCEAAGRKTALIADIDRDADFAYSIDRRTWTSTFNNIPPPEARFQELRSERILIRFRGDLDIVEQAQSGRPDKWLRPNADL